MQFDLENMNRKELEKLRSDIDKALERLAARDRKNALAAADRAAREYGFSLAELKDDVLSARSRGRSRTPVPAKYRSPDDPTKTWSGRGRRPEWIKRALENGKSLEDMEIRGS